MDTEGEGGGGRAPHLETGRFRMRWGGRQKVEGGQRERRWSALYSKSNARFSIKNENRVSWMTEV
jgi:hypothetical protein